MYEEKLNEMLNKFDELDLEALQMMLKNCTDYLDKVVKFVTSPALIGAKMDGEEKRKAIEQLDVDRHNTHEALISSVKMVNRICQLYGMDPIYDGDMANRYDIAMFAEKLVSEIYTKEITRTRGKN